MNDTQKKLLLNYNLQLDKYNLIINLGKFEREPLWTVYFYDLMLNGDGELLEDGITQFIIQSDDVTIFPELKDYNIAQVIIRDDGFVTCNLEDVDKNILHSRLY